MTAISPNPVPAITRKLHSTKSIVGAPWPPATDKLRATVAVPHRAVTWRSRRHVHASWLVRFGGAANLQHENMGGGGYWKESNVANTARRLPIGGLALVLLQVLRFPCSSRRGFWLSGRRAAPDWLASESDDAYLNTQLDNRHPAQFVPLSKPGQ